MGTVKASAQAGTERAEALATHRIANYRAEGGTPPCTYVFLLRTRAGVVNFAQNVAQNGAHNFAQEAVSSVWGSTAENVLRDRGRYRNHHLRS